MKLLRCITFSCIVCLLSGCASSVFIPYPEHLAQVRQPLASDQPKQALAAIQDQKGGQDIQLYGAELGRVQQLEGQYAQSLKSYAAAIQQVRSQELGAQIQGRRVAANVGSWFVNANIIPYRMSGYEVVFLYLYQAMNYLALHDITNALVSIRRAGNAQQYLKQQYYRELVKAQKEAKKKGWSFKTKDYKKQFASTMAAAAKVKSAFENAYFYYLSAILYEAAGDMNDASVSIRQAVKVAPNNPVVRQSLWRILQQQGSTSLLDQFKHAFGSGGAASAGSAQIVVIFENGLVPAKQQVTIPIPIPGFQQIQLYTFPVYRGHQQPPTPLHVKIHGQHSLQTVDLLNVRALAARALVSDYFSIFLQQTLQFTTKTVMTDQLEHKTGVIGALAGMLYSAATSGADLRSWLTLPNTVSIAQKNVPAGLYHLSLNHAGQHRNLTVTLKRGQTALLWVVQVGRFFKVRSLLM